MGIANNRVTQLPESGKFPLKSGIFALAAFSLLIMFYMMMGVNYIGYRTVVQTAFGNTFVKSTPGPYLLWFGHAETYPDFITYDFDQSKENNEPRSINQEGITVRYQEGGTGTVYGQVRFKLPDDPETMLALHRSYRTPEGVSYKLVKPSVDEIESLTANLMTSDESYMEKRNTFGEWAREQLQNGKFLTTLQTKEVKEEGTDKTVYRSVPVIALDTNGLPKHGQSDLKTYGLSLASIQHTNPDYEPKTIDQIQARRAATMAIITAKAEAERAKQDSVTAEQTGLKNVTIAKYEKEVEKQRAVVDAERLKEVAEIAAKQRVSVAEQEKLEQEQKKLAAAEYKQAETLKGEGDAAYKKAVIEADGALAQKLTTYEKVMGKFAEEFGKQKWVPNIQMGAPASGNSNQASTLIDMLTAKAAKDLSLDLETKTPTKK